MKSSWIEYNGKKIMYIDLANFSYDERGFDRELTETIATIGQQMYAMPLNSVLVAVDLRNTKLTGKIQKLLTERIADTKKYVQKTAVIGLTGIRGIFLDYFARIAGAATVGFEDPTAAKNWLTR